MDKHQLKDTVCDVIDRNRRKIIDIGNEIFSNPELGYKEYKTAAVVEQVWRELGLPFRNKLALTGSKALLKGCESRAVVALMGEMDAVLCPEHPNSDVETGAAHSCGHNAQIAGLIGAAIGLADSGAAEHLAGDVAFIAVPAEEPVEIEFRQRLREKGEISFLGGKQEMIKTGVLDGIDMTVMFHATVSKDGKKAFTAGTSNGFVAKLIRYKGREAHAGGSPHTGINALNAAILGLQGIHAQRETFREADYIRIHPIITRGGDLVNIVPADVRIETYVRGKTMEAVIEASRKVNRALKAGAMAVGAEVEIAELPGFYPRDNDEVLSGIFRANLEDLLGKENVGARGHGTGSSDIGDVMHIMPAVHPYIGGMKGRSHTSNYSVVDEDLLYIVSSKAMAMTVVDLLADGAGKALKLKERGGFLSKAEYLDSWKKFTEGAGKEE